MKESTTSYSFQQRERNVHLYRLLNAWHFLFCQHNRWKLSSLKFLSAISCLATAISFLNHIYLLFRCVFFKAHVILLTKKRVGWWGGLREQHKGLPYVEFGIRQMYSQLALHNYVFPFCLCWVVYPVWLIAWRSRPECLLFVDS